MQLGSGPIFTTAGLRCSSPEVSGSATVTELQLQAGGSGVIGALDSGRSVIGTLKGTAIAGLVSWSDGPSTRQRPAMPPSRITVTTWIARRVVIPQDGTSPGGDCSTGNV